MGRLSGSDYRAVLEVLYEAAAVDGDIPFPEPVLEALRQLVPCDVVAYHERADPGTPRRIVWSGEPRGPVTPEVRAANKRLEHLDPLKPAPGARKYSDLFSRRDFHGLDIYQELARPLGIEDMFRLWLEPTGAGEARLEFDRPDRGFRERDREVLDLLRPHLAQVRANALRRRNTTRSRDDQLTRREREILELVAQGHPNAEIARILWISPGTVRKHLENAYEKLDVHNRTAAVAAIRSALPEP